MFDFHNSTNNDVILHITVWLLLPMISLYALYIQIHGEISPGGGFQSGVVFTVAYILFLLSSGVNKIQKLFPEPMLIKFITCGVLIYLIVGCTSIFMGGNFLEYERFLFTQSPQTFGLFLVEIGIGISVFGAMSTIIFCFYSVIKKVNTTTT